MSEEKKNYLLPKILPPNLNKEALGVWMGWNAMGNREVAREAAAKGLHVDLAVGFLSLRNKSTSEDARIWFINEVLVWVDELLNRQQIFRVSHILNNVGLDSLSELTKIFYKTKREDLREYIGNHLNKLGNLDEKMKQLWHLLNLILRNNLLISKYKLPESSLECLSRQNEEWKYEIAAKLFLRTYDPKLVPFLNAETLWKQLLLYNDTKFIKSWINIRYTDKVSDVVDAPDTVANVFQTFDISNSMLDEISSSEVSENTRNVVSNELSKYGMFSHSERSFIRILNRLNQSNYILELYSALTKTTSNVGLIEFLNLLIDYCLDNKLYSVLNECVKDFEITEFVKTKKSHYLKMLNDLRSLTSNFNENILSANIFNVAQILSTNLDTYFSCNPLILLALIFLTKDLGFLTVIKDRSLVIHEVELYGTLENVIKMLSLVNSVYKKQMGDIHQSHLTMYNLLERHLNVNVKDLFYFRFADVPMSHFNSSKLVEKCGYSKKINFALYLKYCRPSIACKHFILSQIQSKSFLNYDLKKVISKKTFRVAFKFVDCVEITSSCVALLEMIDYSSDYLRVSLRAAHVMLDFGYSINEVQNIFYNIEDDPYAIRHILEEILIERIHSNTVYSGAQLVDDIKTFDLIFKFSIANNLSYPESLLIHFASNNLWLAYLIYSQIKNYPIEQVKTTLQFLKNPNLLEHINHSVVHDIHIDDQNILMRDRDSRKYFLSRIGVRQSLDTISQLSDSIYSSITSQSSWGSAGSSAGSDFLEIDILNTKATLLQTLIRCHNSTDPPRALLQACQLYKNPLLAVFATSYEPDSVVTNWLTWLAVSSELCKTFTNFESIAICANSVTSLLSDCMKERYPMALIQSFEVFLPENPLKPFLEFLNMSISLNLDVPSLRVKLTSFKNFIAKTRRNSVLSDADHEMTYLNNKMWLQKTALILLSSALEYNFNSVQDQIRFLEVICVMKFEEYFSEGCPKFQNILNILKNLLETTCDIKFNISLAFDDKTERKAVVDCINELLDRHFFKTAEHIARISGLPLDLILIKEWQNKFESHNVNPKFWEECNEVFLSSNVTADCVIDFYLECLEKVETRIEKYKLIRFSYEWANRFDLSIKYDLEKKMWLAYLDLEEKWKFIEFRTVSHNNYLYKEVLEQIKDLTEYEGCLPENLTIHLDELLASVLNKGDILRALKLEKMFNCKSNDLDILKLSYSLAESILLPFQLNVHQKLLLTRGAKFRKFSSHRRTFLSARFSSYSSASQSPASSSLLQESVEADSPSHDALVTLHTLSEKIINGAELARSIFMTYRISLNIEIPYQIVVSNTDHMKMLKDALEDDCMNKLKVVHDFMCVFKWSKEQIVDFICEEIVNAASQYVKSKTDNFTMWDLNMDQEFHLVLQLLQDNCSVLGYKIYSYASALHKMQIIANMDYKISELSLVIELLIASHSCFTADCNMEGITIVLKKCQTVVSHLLTLRSWKLIVRLLTGIGRYTEMNYVFQILRENDQFEFLLRKGSRKDSALKVALLDYLKKYCPENKELYKIVALHFTLFSEVALLWEREAQGIMRNLIAISKLEMQNNKLNPDTEPFVLFTNTDGTRKCLQNASDNYIHATEFHLHGEKVAKAMNAAKQAELLALQMSMLKGLPNTGTAICLLNLSKSQIASLITSELSFEQSQILVEAYHYHADWGSVLYEQCITKNNSIYLHKFMRHFPLTDTLVNDISRKFLSANINTPNELNSMKHILNKVSSVHTKYRIASELGFTDVVEELISRGQLAFLKDTVWKKGYKNS